MKSNPVILLVEDEVISAMLLQNELEENGYPVRNHVTTGEDAVSSAAELNPHLIIMDIGLAGEMDGITAAGKIREKAETPVLFLTCYNDRETRERAGKLSPVAYLIKPYAIADLKKELDVLFEEGN